MPITLDGTNGITTPTYGGADTSEYLVPVTGFKNRIINGNMTIDQRNAGASVTIGSGGTYLVDRFYFFTTQASKLSGQRSTIAPSGFVNSTLITVTAAVTPVASDNFIYAQIIEGSNIADFGMGTAGAVTFTVSFWVRSSVTGTFSCRVANGGTGGAPNRSYVSTFTINAANTWEYKTITIAGDTSGTWQTGTSGGIEFTIDLGSGSNFNTTANAWQAGNFTRTSGSTSLISTNGATFYITGVQLEVGSTATSFDYRPYGTEFDLCKRYYYRMNVNQNQVIGTGWAYSTTLGEVSVPFRPTMRATPTFGSSAASNFNINYITCTALVLSDSGQATADTACIKATTAGSLGSGFGTMLRSGAASQYVEFSAEL